MTLAPRLLALPLAAAIAAVALAGCASQAASAPSASPTPDGSGGSPEIDAAWLDDGRMIGLVTMGSSTCVPAADEAMLEADGSLSVTLLETDEQTACTADMAPRVTLVAVPEGVNPADDLAITVTGDGDTGSTELDGVEGLGGGGMTDYLPSAGWTETDGQFVLLTWGSSSCAPVISAVAATAPAEVTVSFETPPADQVCTMDMAPRATIAYVDGLEEDSNVEAVLTGSPEFDNVRIPIYGEN
jgi:hypothetical protein